MGMSELWLACYVREGGGVWRRVYECEGDVGRLSVRWVRGCAERLVWERVSPLPDAVLAVVDGELRLRLVRVDVMAGEVCVWRGYLVRAVHGGGVYRYECWGYRLWSPDVVSYRVCAGARADTVFLDVLRQVMGRAGAVLWDQPCGWYQALCGMELPAQLFVESPVGEVWDWLEQRTGYAVVEGERWDVDRNAGYAHWLVDWGAGEELLAVEVSDADVVWDVDYSGVATRLRFVGSAPAVANRLSNGRVSWVSCCRAGLSCWRMTILRCRGRSLGACGWRMGVSFRVGVRRGCRRMGSWCRRRCRDRKTHMVCGGCGFI
jgi:hypothetical protein